MKKIILPAIVLTTALCAFAGCGGGSSPTYDALNSLLDEVTSYELTVSTTTGGETLSSNYAVTETEGMYEITYSYEVLNELDLTNPQAGYKSVKTGVALVVDGEVVSDTGDALNVILSKPSLNFEAVYFSSVQDDSGEFSADVTDAAAFLSVTQQISGMSVVVDYTEAAIEQIEINYSTAVSEVTITYSFN